MNRISQAVVLLLSLFCAPCADAASRIHKQGEWMAHPPIHIQHDAQSAPAGYAPAQIRHAYGFDVVTQKGAGQTLAIVDAFDDPTAAADLATFIATFHLQTMYGLPGTGSCTAKAGPHPCFQVTYAQGTKPKADAGWALETSLDVQWAHAAAPAADIVLVETSSSAITPLLKGVDTAVSAGAHVVSMSWGGPEFATEHSYDSHFHKTGVAFLASSGDDGTGQSYSASSSYVLSVGGTTLPLDSGGTRTGAEKGWKGSGGGVSVYETEPAFQTAFAISSGGHRAGPDVSFDADPATGVSVYDSTPSDGKAGWYSVGGTSAAAPQWAGIVAMMDEQRKSGPLSTGSLQQSFAYDAAVAPGRYRDIRSGKNGTCGAGCKAAAGYDLVTGLGSPIVQTLVPAMTN